MKENILSLTRTTSLTSSWPSCGRQKERDPDNTEQYFLVTAIIKAMVIALRVQLAACCPQNLCIVQVTCNQSWVAFAGTFLKLIF